MAVETMASNAASGPVAESVPAPNATSNGMANGVPNMVPINTPRGKLTAPQQAARLRLVEEDLARLQDQLMDVLEENQQLRGELEAWRTGARTLVKQAS